MQDAWWNCLGRLLCDAGGLMILDYSMVAGCGCCTLKKIKYGCSEDLRADTHMILVELTNCLIAIFVYVYILIIIKCL